MTTTLTLFGKFGLPAAAAALSVFGLGGDSDAHVVADTHPVACAFLVEDSRFGPAIKGVVIANEDVRGSFEMTFSKRGANSANVTQSGNFTLYAGDTATLGQATLGRGEVDATLELTIDGQTLMCQSPGLTDL